MKIYTVAYIGMDDNHYNEFYTSKSEAQKRYNRMKKTEDKVLDDYEDDNPAECKMVFDIHEADCEISKKGIIDYLQRYFSESSG